MSKHNRGRPHHLFNLEDLFSRSFFQSFLLLYRLNDLLQVLDLLCEPLEQLLGLASCRGKHRLLESHVLQFLEFLEAQMLLAVRHHQEDLWIHYEVLVVLHCTEVLPAIEELAALFKLSLLEVSKA